MGPCNWAKCRLKRQIFLELTRMDRLFNKFPVFDASGGFTSELASESEDVATDKVVQAQPVAA